MNIKGKNHNITIQMVIEDDKALGLVHWLEDESQCKEGTFMAMEENSYTAVDFRNAHFEKHHAFNTDSAITVTLQTRENDSERSSVHFKDIFNLAQ